MDIGNFPLSHSLVLHPGQHFVFIYPDTDKRMNHDGKRHTTEERLLEARESGLHDGDEPRLEGREDPLRGRKIRCPGPWSLSSYGKEKRSIQRQTKVASTGWNTTTSGEYLYLD